MREACSLVWSVLVLLFRSRASLEAEILILRHQLKIQRRHVPKRVAFSAMDRLIFVGLYRLVPNTIKALAIVKPDTVIRWRPVSDCFGAGNRVTAAADVPFETSGRELKSAYPRLQIEINDAANKVRTLLG